MFNIHRLLGLPVCEATMGAVVSDVFISYKRDDLAIVGRLVSALRSRGLTVWWDQDIAPDAPWEATIERELDGAKVVIVAWSQAAVASDNVKAEARRARQHGKLIQVFAERCEPPLFFGERQGVDLRGWNGDIADSRFQSIFAGTQAIMAGQRPPAGIGYAPKKRPPVLLVAGASLLVIAAISIVASSGVARDAVCAVASIGCPQSASAEVDTANADLEEGAGVVEPPPAVAETPVVEARAVEAQPPAPQPHRDPQAHFPNAPDTEDFCGTIRQVAQMVDDGFAAWRRGESVVISGATMWRSSFRLPAAATCHIQQMNASVPPAFSCQWQMPSIEEAASESRRLEQAIRNCPGAVPGTQGRPLIGNALFWVRPMESFPDQVGMLVMWS